MIDAAVREYDPAAVFGLFSGGHDSLTSTAIAAQHADFTAAVHINTGIGIEETREFVRETCKEQGWPLIELHSEHQYEDLVLTRGGFPSGPKSHSSMYWFLKQKPLDALIRQTKRRRGDNVVLVTGIRVQESVRRMGAGISVPIRRDDHCRVWVNPILDWSAADCLDFMEREGLRRNPVVDLLHRSGECLCGALAREEEIHEIDLWFPEAGRRIHALEERARACGLKNTRWASRKAWGAAEQMTLEMCSSCTALSSAQEDRDMASKMTPKQAGKKGALVRKGLPKSAAQRIAKPKR
jgi:3'-phosphoadenosine 5'-phosphosulfate sulfotransferase (PAPS reductase)/FAD synthetase